MKINSCKKCGTRITPECICTKGEEFIVVCPHCGRETIRGGLFTLERAVKRWNRSNKLERMQNEQKSRAKGTQTSEENQAQSGETRSQIVVKRFDDYHYEEVELCGLVKHWL